MTIAIFIAVLALLILVHEAGHFFMAKWSGMRVDEFGLGFPPRATSYKPDDSETTYSLNWLPIGGFVRIFGENLEEIDPEHKDKDRSFSAQSTTKQVLTLVAGVTMNMLLAFLCLVASFMVGKVVVDDGSQANLSDSRVLITQVMSDSPAESAGLEAGSQLKQLSFGTSTLSGADITPEAVQKLVKKAGTSSLQVTTQLGESSKKATVTPAVTDGHDPQIGIAMAQVGTLQTGPIASVVRGASATVNLTEQTLGGFYTLVKDAVSGGGESLAQVAGPVGIADLVGDAADRGLAPLLSFIALISINLAILNLLPFPALDGGRVVFSLYEGITGKDIPPKVGVWANGIGMALLLLLMIVITFQDITRLL
jgi:regulator of sigma E protease